MDVNETYRDHFTTCRNVESLCCAPEMNMLYVNYTSMKNRGNRGGGDTVG